jgi:hypothetical protein
VTALVSLPSSIGGLATASAGGFAKWAPKLAKGSADIDAGDPTVSPVR